MVEMNTSKQNTPAIAPVPNATLPFWRTDLDEIDEHRTTHHLPTECDILIIGAGFSGASTAYHLYKNASSSPNPDVVMVEARQVSSGATGRNG